MRIKAKENKGQMSEGSSMYPSARSSFNILKKYFNQERSSLKR
jgi:hypothetical protein